MSAAIPTGSLSIPEQHIKKRKWTTGIMKSWHGTDPSSTAPNVEYSDPKAAARAAKHKRRKTEAANQKAVEGFTKPTQEQIGGERKTSSTSTSPQSKRTNSPSNNMTTSFRAEDAGCTSCECTPMNTAYRLE
ncbi:hypothetical protein HDZ31DRAFT_78785, partial [Schizophyllum fasciatum]